MRFVSTSFQQSSSFYARTSGSESGSLISSSFFIVTKTDLGGFDANFGTKKLIYTIPSASTGGSADVKALMISASGNNPKIGIGTQDPKATFDIKEERDDTIGTRFLLKSSRTITGAQIGDSAGSINFAIDSASFNDIFSSGSVASIDSKVRAINISSGGTPNVAGNIIFKSSPEWIENLNEIAEIGYFHFDNLDPSEDSEPGMIINGQLTVGSGSQWQSQAGDVAFSVHNVDRPNMSSGNNLLKFRITGSNAVIHSGSLAIGSGSLFLGETYSGATQVEVLNLRGQNSIKLGHINGGSGNHPLEIYTANGQLAAKFDNSQNLGIGPSQDYIPEKLTVEGNISASGNLIATDFVASGNITVTGTVDGVDVSALNSTVSTNTSNIITLTAATSSYLTSIPAGTISSSVQIDHDQTTNFSTDEHFTQANITTVGTVTSGDVSAILPSGTVSGSSQTVANLDGQIVTIDRLIVRNSVDHLKLQNDSGTATYVNFSPQGGLEINPGGVGNSISASSDITTHGDIIGKSTHIKLIGPNGGGGSFTYLSSSGDPAAGSFKLSLGDIDGVGNTTTITINDNTEQISLSKALSVTGNITVTGTVDGVDIASLENSVQANDTKIASLTAVTSSYSTATGVENNADVTDFTNVQAAGALMDSEVTSLSLIKGLTAAQISGAFDSVSASLASDIPTNNNQLTNGAGYLTTVDISTDTNLVGGTNLTLSGDTMNLDESINLTTVSVGGYNAVSAAGTILDIGAATEWTDIRYGKNGAPYHNFQGRLSTTGDITASNNVDIQGTLSLPGFADVSASLAAAVAGGDNLGNHTATQNLNMGTYAITNVGNVDGVDVSTLKSDFDTLEGKTLVSGSSQITIGSTTGTITSAKISDVDAFSQSGTYASLRAQGTTATDVGLGNVENTALSTYTGNGGALDNQYITNGAGYTTNTGTVDTTGTPASEQIALFSDSDTIQGSSKLTFDVSETQLKIYASNTDGAHVVIDGGAYGSPAYPYIDAGGLYTGLTFGSSTSGRVFDFKNNKIAFDVDYTNTYIMADTNTPENLEIHADGNIELRADDDLQIFSDVDVTGNVTASGDLSINGFPSVSASLAAAGGGSPTTYRVAIMSNGFYSQADLRYLTYNTTTETTSANTYISIIPAAADGKVISVTCWPQSSGGSSELAFYVNGGTASTTDTQTLTAGVPVQFTFSSGNTFSALDELAFSIDPTNTPNGLSFQIILEYDY